MATKKAPAKKTAAKKPAAPAAAKTYKVGARVIYTNRNGDTAKGFVKAVRQGKTGPLYTIEVVTVKPIVARAGNLKGF